MNTRPQETIDLDHTASDLETSLLKLEMKDAEEHTARTEDMLSDCESDHQILAKFLGHESFSCSVQQPLQRVEEDEESNSELTLDDEYNFDTLDPSLRTASNHSHSLQGSSFHSKVSGISLNSVCSIGSLKIVRRPAADWKTSGHDSISYFKPFDDESEEGSEADNDDDLKVLCSRDSTRLKLLGEGNFGQVWLVRHKHKSYALKVCAKYELVSEGAVQEVVREREILSQLDHPFICRLWATNQDRDFVFLLEDYLAGGELYSLLERQEDGRILASQAQLYTACIADALAYLHERYIVFRDIKPENIMISNRGFPTLIDFGCAKQVEEAENFLSRTMCGTPRFVSPEMIDRNSFGGGHGVGTDHWALGILLYEMLSGDNPFWYEDMSDLELYEQIPVAEVDWTPFQAIGTPRDAIDLMQKLLIKHPAKRLGSQGEAQVLQHPWLAPIDVKNLRSLQVPWVPDLTDPTDTQYFDDWEGQVQDRFRKAYPILTAKEEAHFADF